MDGLPHIMHEVLSGYRVLWWKGPFKFCYIDQELLYDYY